MNDVQGKLARCIFPALAEPYQSALREAVTYILERYDDAVGIIAAGSILRGQGHATSDLDLYVIRTRPQRQRVQRRFQGVAAEIFVNPPRQIARYFADEARDTRPITAHMLAQGAVFLALTLREQKRAQAEAELQRAPPAGCRPALGSLPRRAGAGRCARHSRPKPARRDPDPLRRGPQDAALRLPPGAPPTPA